MDSPLTYELDDGVATLTMDDGKANALSLQMISALHGGLDQAKADKAVVVLTGREGLFCAGFHLKTVQAGGFDSLTMVRAGMELTVRMLSFDYPIVIACSGHAIAMGSFLLLSGDHRIGAQGDFKIVANEVAIGMTMPFGMVELMRSRLNPPAFHRAINLSTVFDPDQAAEAGYLDEAVPADDLLEIAEAAAKSYTELNLGAHAATKLRARAPYLDAIRAGIAKDFESLKPPI